MRVSSKSALYFCLLFFVNSCANSGLIIQNIELKQDIHSDGILDISSKMKFPVAPSEINIRFRPDVYWLGLGSAEAFGIKFRNPSGEFIEVGYNVYHEVFYIHRRHTLTLALSETPAGSDLLVPYSINEVCMLDMKIMLNTNSIVLYSSEEEVVLADAFSLSSELNTIELYAENGKVYVESVSLSQLKTVL